MRLVVIASLALCACLVEVDYTDTQFSCGLKLKCPPGFFCDGVSCQTVALACGDGVLTGQEQCEAPFESCCDPSICAYRSGTICRARVGECDVTELCSGASATCPADLNEVDDASCVGGRCLDGVCESDRLVAHWSFDGVGADAIDISGNGNDAQILGPSRVAGRFGGALEFAGTGDHVVDTGGGAYLNGLAAVTLTMWVRSNQTMSDRGLLTSTEPLIVDGPDAEALSLRYDAAGVLGGQNTIKFGVETTLRQQSESSSDVQSTDWQFLAVTWESGSDVRLYVNGVLDASTEVDPIVTGVIGNAEAIHIGRGAKDVTTSWDGLIDDVRIYDRVLVADEIEALAAL